MPIDAHPTALSTVLLRRWADVLPDHPELAERLLARYAEPHRRYHTAAHLAFVLDQIDALAPRSADLFAVRVAAWFHDAVYAVPVGQVSNEEASSRLAVRELQRLGLEQEEINRVARLVRLTESHAPRGSDPDGALLCDADLAILAGTPEEYAAYRAAVRDEYAALPDDAFAAGRYAVLSGLLAGDLFRTARGRRLTEPARANLQAELDFLAAAHPELVEGSTAVTVPTSTDPSSTAATPTPRGDLTWGRPTGWWRNAVVYQIYPRSFADSNFDGVGDIPGITRRLDYLHELGVDAVWLSPVYVSPMDDNGYDIADYQDVDPIFGRLTDLNELIAALHARGMKLVMDLVVNHTSDEHPWFVESRDPSSPKRDWYFWRPPRPGHRAGEPGAEPTNWESAFLGSAWQLDDRSGEYYLHLFTRKQPDLNWENPEVREAVYAMMRWWLDRGVDGFRMDVINLISKPAGLPDGPVEPGHTYSRALRLLDGGRLHEFLREMNERVLSGRSLVTVGEMPGSTIEQARRFTDPARAELDMVFTFEHVMLDQRPGGSKYDIVQLALPVLKQNLAAWQEGLADVGWNSLYWNNHDQPRAVSRFGDDSPEHRVNSAKTLGTILHLHRGTPYVYQGEELGMTNAAFSELSQYRDVEALNFHASATSLGMEAARVLAALSAKSRDNARTPMQWSDDVHAGFTGATPWLTVNPNYVVINAETAMADPSSVFHHYRRLIELRHTSPVVVDGRFELLLADHASLWAFTRTLGTELLLVLANCTSADLTLPLADLPDFSRAELVLGTHSDVAPDVLRPWESRLYRLTPVET